MSHMGPSDDEPPSQYTKEQAVRDIRYLADRRRRVINRIKATLVVASPSAGAGLCAYVGLVYGPGYLLAGFACIVGLVVIVTFVSLMTHWWKRVYRHFDQT